jgi:hypothetical protein
MLNSYGRYGKAQRIFPEIIRENSGKFLFIWKNPCSSAQHKILCVGSNFRRIGTSSGSARILKLSKKFLRIYETFQNSGNSFRIFNKFPDPEESPILFQKSGC